MGKLVEYITIHRRPLGIIGLVAATFVAAVYFVVLPDGADDTDGLRRSILMYGHSICWLLIAASSAVWAFKGVNSWSRALIYSALAVYVTFLVSVII